MKRVFISLMAIGLILSALTGFLVYFQTDGKLYSSYDEVDNIEWVVPLDSRYFGIYKISTEDENSWYLLSSVSDDADNATYEILDENFKKQSSYSDNDLYVNGDGTITITTNSGVVGRDTFHGLMDSKGKEILPPIYVSISEPKDGYLAATYTKNKKKPSLVFFTEDGKRLFSEEDIAITNTTSIINAGNGIFAITRGGDQAKATIYDAKSRSVLKVLDDVYIITDLKNGTYSTEPATNDTTIDIYDSSFNYIKTLPDNLFAPHSFSEGKAIFNKTAYYKDDAPYVCLDEDFNPLFDIFASEDAISFSEGKSICYNEDSFFCIDDKGNVLFEKPLAKELENIPFFSLHDCVYKNGKAVAYGGTGYGIIDEKGNWIVDPIFETLTYASKDTYIAVTDNLAIGVFKLKN